MIQNNHITDASIFVRHEGVMPMSIESDTEPTDGKKPIIPANRSSPNVGFHPRYDKTTSRAVIENIKVKANMVEAVKSLGFFIYYYLLTTLNKHK